MIRFGVAMMSAGLSACVAVGGGRNSGAAIPVDGTYDFTANLPDQQLRGKMRVVGNEVLLEPATGNCRPIEAPDSLSVRFLCNGSGRYEQLSIRIDRRNPAERSSWAASYRVPRKREVCSEYGTVSGQTVCIRTWTEYYDASEGRNGRLRVRRAT